VNARAVVLTVTILPGIQLAPDVDNKLFTFFINGCFSCLLSYLPLNLMVIY
jgi:hypothetical protein